MSRSALLDQGHRPKPWKVASATGLSFLLLFGQTAPVLGNPTGGDVVAGSASIGSAGKTLTINQSTNQAIINWQTFSINGGELTKFIVPNSSSATLNRVLGGNPSVIYGSLQSNGQLVLINPSGIVVGSSGRIDTSSFLGSTLNVSNDDFLKGGDLHFVGTTDASITNSGSIHATGGDVYLIANQVTNNGALTAPNGNVGLAAGTEVLFQQAGDQHLFVQPTPSGTTRAAGVTNTGTIRAASAELKAAGGNAYALAINNTGHIAATGYKKINGQVYLTADGGNITNSGKITAQNADRNGGTIALNGHGTSAKGTVLNSGKLIASSHAKGKKGGSVQVLGNQVGITGQGLLDVSGNAGGGTVLIGGDEHGANPAISNADQTYLGPDAQIIADALRTGDGGKVILWGQQTTQVYGQISAQGGAVSGNGGFVETSGATLDARTAPNVSAPHGTGGTWLLDPATVTISDTGSDSGFSSVPSAFTLNSGTVTVTQATLLSALVGGNVTIDASQGSGGLGTITWTQSVAPFDIGTISGHTLTLDAPTQVMLNGISITSSKPTGRLNLAINTSGSSGNVQILNSAIDLNGGNFTAVGSGFVSKTQSTSLGQADGVDIYSSTLNVAGGNIVIDGTAGYYLNGAAISAGNGVGIGDSVVETTGAGNISITGNGPPSVASSTGFAAVVISNNRSGSGTGVGSLISAQNGVIDLSGTVSAGTVTTVGDNIFGVALLDDSTIQATGAKGMVVLAGNNSGSTSSGGANIGVFINGYDSTNNVSHTATISVGSSATPSTGGGIAIAGTGGKILTSVTTTGASADGVNLSEGVSLTANGSAPITIVGTGGTNTNSDLSATGTSVGVDLFTEKHGSVMVSTGTGSITLTGSGGKSANAGIGVLLAATNNTSVAANQIHTTVKTGGGNISIFGVGGSGYGGPGVVVGKFVPNLGVAIADYATLQTGGSGAISLMATVKSPSPGVGIEQLPSGSFDAFPIRPTINAGGAFTATSLLGAGIYLNGIINAASATLGTELIPGDLSTISSGPLEIESSTITLNGGDFTAYGLGTPSSVVTSPVRGAIIDGISIDYFAQFGVPFLPTTINAQGGTISLTGKASTATWGGAGFTGTVAGEGILVDGAALLTSGTGGITLLGDASVGNVTVRNSLQAVDIADSTLSVGDGQISITGTVNSGTALNLAAAELQGFGGNGVTGVKIGNSSSSTSTVVQATGTNGSVEIVGDTTGSTTDASDTTLPDHNNRAVNIEGSETSVTSAGNGGISLLGTAGNIINNSSAVDGGTEGVGIRNGATIQGMGAAQITIVGQSGSNTTLGSAVTGSSVGVVVASNGSNSSPKNGNTSITSETGDISITGTSGTSPSKGVGIGVVGTNGAVTTISSSSGNISLTGVGGAGNAGVGGTGIDYLPNFGVAVINHVTLSTGGSGNVSIVGTAGGIGAYGVGIEEITGDTSIDTAPAPATITIGGAFTATALSGTGVYLNGVTLSAASATLGMGINGDTSSITSGPLIIQNSTITLNGGDFTGFGAGYVSATDANGNPDGIQIINTFLNAGGGNINLTGKGGYVHSGAGLTAGIGVNLADSTIETSGSSAVTVVADDSMGSAVTPITVSNDLDAVEISSAVVTTASGAISITGTVSAGTAGSKVEGIDINGGTSVDGTNAAVTLIGSTAGSNTLGLNAGVVVEGTGTTVTAEGGMGLTITGSSGDPSGTSGALANPATYGILLSDGAGLVTSGSAPMTLNGTAGANTSTDPTSVSVGVAIFSPQSDQTTGIQGGTGLVSITGTAGSSASGGIGILLGGPSNLGTVNLTASNLISLNGTGGSGNTSGALPNSGIYMGGGMATGSTIINSFYDLIALSGTAGSGSSPGVAIYDNSTVSGQGIALVGAGTGASPVGVDVRPNVTSTQPILNAGSGALTIASTAGSINLDLQTNSGGSSSSFVTPLGSVSNLGNVLGPISLFGGDFTVTPDFGMTFGTIAAQNVTINPANGGVILGTTDVKSLTVTGTSFSSTGLTLADTISLNITGPVVLGPTMATTSVLITGGGDISQTGALSTPLLTIPAANKVDLTNTGNNIASTGNIGHTSTLAIFTDPGLTVAGAITGNNPVLIEDLGNDLTIGANGQIFGSIVTLVTDHNFINDSTFGAMAIQASSMYDIYSSSPATIQLGGLTPDFTLYNTVYPATSLPPGNGVIYASASPTPPTPSTPPVTPSDVPPSVTPQSTQIAPQQPPTPPTESDNNLLPVSYTDNGVSNQTGTPSDQLANSSGNSGTVGAGDVAQLDNGEINNVANPDAANTLNAALGIEVRNALADALNAFGDEYAAASEVTGTAEAPPGSAQETIIMAGDVVKIGHSEGVQSIPLDQAPQALRDAMDDRALQQTGAAAGH